jgi:2-dehydro-3-deoxygluconokinase
MIRKFVCVGECMLEMSGPGDDLYRLGFAGDSLNTAWYARAALAGDWQVEYLSALGDDIYSARMREFLDEHRIGTRYVRTIEGKCCGLYLIHQADGDRRFTYWRENSAARLLADDTAHLRLALDGAGLVYFSGITLAILTPAAREDLLSAIAGARAKGARTAFDPNIRPALWADMDAIREGIELACGVADIILPSFDDEREVFDDIDPAATARRYLGMGADEVVVKDGEKSAVIASSEGVSEVPAIHAEMVDATGAGDAFNGAYLAARLANSSPVNSAKSAHRIASIVVSHPGGLVDPTLLG